VVVDGWQTLNVNHVLPDVSLYHVVSHAWISMKYEQVNIHGDSILWGLVHDDIPSIQTSMGIYMI
jgi:hypothetical protein